MDFTELQARARGLRGQYAAVERSRHGRPWTTEEIALGFVGDVGDLAKLIQAHAGVRGTRPAEEVRVDIAHELADCLWSVIVLADETGVDLEAAFIQTMEDLERHLQTAG